MPTLKVKSVLVSEKAIATPGTQLAVATSGTLARAVTFVAQKKTGANTGDVYLGDLNVSSSDHFLTMAPGDSYTLDVPDGYVIDLNDIWIDCTGGQTDGVTFQYIGA